MGFRYILLTSKHHDGFCLFDTTSTVKKSKTNICKIFAEECSELNVEYGFYYSWYECDTNFNMNYFDSHCLVQINELLKLKPQYMWFDGDWKITQKSILTQIETLCKNMVSIGIKINSRIGKQLDTNYVTYNVKIDRWIPNLDEIKNFQHVTTIGYSWDIINLMNINQEKKFTKHI